MHDHDPLERQLPHEPRLPILGRDPLGAAWTDLYGVVRERKAGYRDVARVMFDRLMDANDQRAANPQKDKEHAISCRQIATDMRLFYIDFSQSRVPRPTARWPLMSEIKAGSKLVAKGDFDCMRPGRILDVLADAKGYLYVTCAHGVRHYLQGQGDAEGRCSGFYLWPESQVKP